MFKIVLISVIATLGHHLAKSVSMATSEIRIVGGSPATPGEFPYQISFLYNGSHNCGGSILTPSHILTAGHCVNPLPQPEELYLYSVHAGSLKNYTQFGIGQVHGVAQIHRHPLFKIFSNSVGVETVINDVAILVLNNPLIFGPYVGSIKLAEPGITIPTDEPLVASGWGDTNCNREIVASRTLMKVALPNVPLAQCQEQFSDLYDPDTGVATLLGSNICAGRPGVSGWRGDSGGPLVMTTRGPPDHPNQGRVLVGVTSWIRCGILSVFARVSSFRPFIQQYAGV